MTRLWLVRHGPTHAKSMVGWSDIPADLSDTAALARLRDHLPDAPVVSSDLQRAVTTADTLASALRLPHDPNLREINFGAWELKTFAEIEATDPQTIRAYWETPGHVAPPQGESWNAVRQRVDSAIDHYLAQGYDDLIVVAHFGVILTQVQRALGISAYEAFSHRIENLSVTTLVYGPGGWRADQINHNP
ncbi:MAG: histidine phosphatase family protein [Yoonia sp.]|uniref:histidine phosphatase family protein n=1 Tax=Yoonia sp. TaxID=2212373 RepID=UPI00273EBCE2|nr:histidine phosphatase family protein [Yoonia sp.]MDP5086009.1 histidine phosphatase family protein [Yoonia sp.]MDP5362454.1 histidine phosphatase family protein [Paracoccaceae bacterium]